MLTADDLDALVVWNLVRAARVAERDLAAKLRRFELTPQQFGVLAQLSVDGRLTQAALARAVLIRPQSADRVLAALVARGLISRVGERGRGHPNPLELSPAGALLLESLWPEAVATNDLRSKGVDRAHTAELNAVLLALVRTQDSRNL